MGGPLGRGSAARRDPQGGALSPQRAGDPPAPTGTWGFHMSTGLRPAVLPQDSVSLPVRGRMEPCEVRTGQSDVRDASPGPRSPRAQWDHLPRPPGCLGSVVKRACTDARPHPAPRDSLRVFQKLSEIFSDENNYSLSRELLIKVRGGASVSAEVPLDTCRPVWSGLRGARGLSAPRAGGPGTGGCVDSPRRGGSPAPVLSPPTGTQRPPGWGWRVPGVGTPSFPDQPRDGPAGHARGQVPEGLSGRVQTTRRVWVRVGQRAEGEVPTDPALHPRRRGPPSLPPWR